MSAQEDENNWTRFAAQRGIDIGRAIIVEMTEVETNRFPNMPIDAILFCLQVALITSINMINQSAPVPIDLEELRGNVHRNIDVLWDSVFSTEGSHEATLH